MNDILDTALREAVHQCLVNERFYRQNRWAEWSDLRKENRAILRALLKVSKDARRAARRQRDPIDEAKAWALGDHFAGMPS